MNGRRDRLGLLEGELETEGADVVARRIDAGADPLEQRDVRVEGGERLLDAGGIDLSDGRVARASRCNHEAEGEDEDEQNGPGAPAAGGRRRAVGLSVHADLREDRTVRSVYGQPTALQRLRP